MTDHDNFKVRAVAFFFPFFLTNLHDLQLQQIFFLKDFFYRPFMLVRDSSWRVSFPRVHTVDIQTIEPVRVTEFKVVLHVEDLFSGR